MYGMLLLQVEILLQELTTLGLRKELVDIGMHLAELLTLVPTTQQRRQQPLNQIWKMPIQNFLIKSML